jgi:hypothetical protein
MKTLNTIFAIIFLLLFYSCSNNNPVTTNNTDPNLLFSSNELMCDFHDSLFIATQGYYFLDSLKYTVAPNRTFAKIKVTGDLEVSAIDSIYKEIIIATRQNDSTWLNPLDSIYRNLNAVNNSYNLTFNLKYPVSSEFKVEFYIGLFVNPHHNYYMKLKNIKIYKNN